MSFTDVVHRLVATSRELPDAKIIGINHWYRHTSTSCDAGAVKEGLQHLSFQPLLLNLPAHVPANLQIRWSMVDDDEFVWRVHEEWGAEAVVKLRYMIAKFDVGKMEGGNQTGGMQYAQAKQMRESAEIIHHIPKFKWVRRSAKDGRLSVPRARLRVDLKEQSNVMIGGRRAGPVIEKLVRERA